MNEEQTRRGNPSLSGSVMISARTTARMRIARGKTAGLTTDLGALFRDLAKALFDSYRPELHYMRGPGPKWRAKHAPPPAHQSEGALLAMIRLPICVRARGHR
jgi:hypothetical protein